MRRSVISLLAVASVPIVGGLLLACGPSEERKALESFKTSPSADKARDFVRRFPQSEQIQEVELGLWLFASQRDDLDGYRTYVEIFPQGPYARNAREEIEMAALRASPSWKEAKRLWRPYDESKNNPVIAKCLRRCVREARPKDEKTLPPEILAQVFEASEDSNLITVSFEGLGCSECCDKFLMTQWNSQLKMFDMTLKKVDQSGQIHVKGTVSYDRTRTYRWSDSPVSLNPSLHPAPLERQAHPETLVFQIGVHTGTPPKEAWSIAISATTQSEFTHTWIDKYGFGAVFKPTGSPEQDLIHRVTLGEFKETPARVLSYD